MMTFGSIRIFFDPVTAIAVAVGVKATGELVKGFSAAADAQNDAEFAFMQADQEKILRRQELEDFDKEQRRIQARANAVLAAQGADLTAGTPFELELSRSAETAEGRRRIEAQSRAREQGFRSRAKSFQRKGRLSLFGGFLNAAGTVATGTRDFLDIKQTQAETGA